MLRVKIPDLEFYDEKANQFIMQKGCDLLMEHSLVSIAKWESKWHKPFLSEKNDKTLDETIDYYRCMTITQNVNPNVYRNITKDVAEKIYKYINDPMTATWFNDRNAVRGSRNEEVITAEILYYDMIALGIPFECEKWHLNRLLTLIRVVSIKNAPSKKMSKNEVLERQRRLNAQRRAKMNSKG